MTSRTILVTGASRGIGFATAKALLVAGHNVVITARNQSALEALKESYPGQTAFLAGDLAKDDSLATKLVRLAIDTFGSLHGLVVNHGVIEPLGRVADVSMVEWKASFETNVFSGLVLAQAAIPELRKTKGMILWISSGAASKPYIAWSAYGTAKAALTSISAHISAEEQDVTSFALAPGVVATDMQTVIRATDTMDSEQHKKFTGLYEDDKLLKPEWVGEVVAKIVSKADASLDGKSYRITDDVLSEYNS